MSIDVPLLKEAWANRFRWKVLAGALVLWLVPHVCFYFANGPDFRWGAHATVYAVCAISSISVTLWARRCPKPAPGKLGIALALSYGEGTNRSRVREDFADQLRSLIRKADREAGLQMLEVPEHLCESLDSDVTLEEVAVKCRARFALRCNVRQRPLNGAVVYVLDLSFIVRYQANHPMSGLVLNEEVKELFPRHLEIPEDGAHITFARTANGVSVATQYALAIAALVSGDAEYSLKLLAGAQSTLSAEEGRRSLDAALHEKIRSAKDTAHIAIVQQNYHKWTKSGAPEAGRKLVYSYSQLTASLRARPSLKLLYAAGLFMLEPKSNVARQIVQVLAGDGLADAYISCAFLSAFDGDFLACRKAYGEARRHGATDRGWTTAIQFTARAVDLHPDRPYLLFAIGAMYGVVHGEHSPALTYLAEFSSHPAVLPQHARAAETMAADLRNRASMQDRT
jgi:hypothetical protein